MTSLFRNVLVMIGLGAAAVDVVLGDTGSAGVDAKGSACVADRVSFLLVGGGEVPLPVSPVELALDQFVNGVSVGLDGAVYIANDSLLRIEPTSRVVKEVPLVLSEFVDTLGIRFVTADSSGNLIIATACLPCNDNFINEGGLILRTDASLTEPVIIGGQVSANTSFGDGGAATEAGFRRIRALVLDSADNIFVIDDLTVRRIDAESGIVTTVAGDGTSARSGDGSPTAGGMQPSALAIDGSFLWIVDLAGGERLRRLDLAAGQIETLVDFAAEPDVEPPLSGLGVNRAGEPIYAAFRSVWKFDPGNGDLVRVAGTGSTEAFTDPAELGDGGPAIDARFLGLRHLALDGDDNIYVTDRTARRVRRIEATTGEIETIAGGQTIARCSVRSAQSVRASIASIEVDSLGRAWIVDTRQSVIWRLDEGIRSLTAIIGRGSVAGNVAVGAEFENVLVNSPQAIAFDADNNGYFSAAGGIFRVDRRSGIVTKVVDNFCLPIENKCVLANALAFAPDGTLIVSSAGQVHRVDVDTGTTTLLAGTGEIGITGDGGPPLDAKLAVSDVIVLPDGDLVLQESSLLRRVDFSENKIDTIYQEFGSFEGISLQPDGKIIAAFGASAVQVDPDTGASVDIPINAPVEIFRLKDLDVSPNGTIFFGAETSFSGDVMWKLTDQLSRFSLPPSVGEGDRAGEVVAIANRRMHVSSPNNLTSDGRGMIGIYFFDGCIFTLEQQITVPPGFIRKGTGTRFGSAMAANADHLVVGGATDVAVYRRDQRIWALDQPLTASATNGDFGAAIAVQGDRVFVGAPADSGGTVHVFDLVSGVWEENQVLSAPGTGTRFFGQTLVAEGELLVVGAPGDSGSPGKAFVYREEAGVYGNSETLTGSSNGDEFGASLAIVETDVFVGAPNPSGAGQVMRYETNGAVSLVASYSGTPGAEFGRSLDAAGEKIVIGEPAFAAPDGTVGQLLNVDLRNSGSGPSPVRARLKSIHKGLPGSTLEAVGASVSSDGRTVIAGAPESACARGDAALIEEINPLSRIGFEGTDQFPL